MRTIEITRFEDVKAGDIVTVESFDGERQAKGPVEHVIQEANVLHLKMFPQAVNISQVWGFVIQEPHFRFVSATREVPEWEPGTAGKATVRGIKGVRVMRTSGTGGADVMWLSASMISGVRGHREGEVTDFVPDDASRWAAQAKLVEIDLDNARAEVERWKAEAEMLTAKVDRLMPLQEHENECAYRQRAEKAEAEVERLRAARTVPTREQAVAAIEKRLSWASIHWGVEHLHPDALPEIAGAVLALIEQGGA